MKNKFEQLQRLQSICNMLSSFSNRYIAPKVFAEQFGVTERTIHDDLKLLKEVYDAPISYSRANKGYSFTEPFGYSGELGLKPKDLSVLKLAVATLSQYKHLGIYEQLEDLLAKIEKSIKFKTDDSTSKYDFIQFESVPFFAGGEWVDFFIQVIQEKKCVAFAYQKFKDEAPQLRTLHPYFLKEHRNRWYVIGHDESAQDIRMFGLDRLSKPRLVEDIQYKPNRIDLAKLFDDSFGIFIDFKSKPEEVILSFTPQRAKYLKSQPFHAQQLDPKRILADNSQEFRVKFNFILNQELLMELARLGKDVKVIKPQKLEDDLRKYHQAAL